MDITDALAPTSDQLDAIELVVPRTFTIDAGSRLGQREGKTVAEIRLVDFPRVWRPSKGMLDVLAHCWGLDAKQWVGRRVTVYNDPEVRFGPDRVGGVRISHLSHIDGPRDLDIRASGKGKRQKWHVEPLTEPARPATSAPDIATITDRGVLREMYRTTPNTDRARQDAIKARVAELDSAAADDPTLDAAWGGGDPA